MATSSLTLGVRTGARQVGPVRFVETNPGEDASFGAARLARRPALVRPSKIVDDEHRHERLDRATFRGAGRWTLGRTIYRTAGRCTTGPARILVRMPAAPLLFPTSGS